MSWMDNLPNSYVVARGGGSIQARACYMGMCPHCEKEEEDELDRDDRPLLEERGDV